MPAPGGASSSRNDNNHTLTIVSVKTESGGESIRAELSDGSVFSFLPCYLPPDLSDKNADASLFCEGRELAANEEEGLRFASACARAERTALRLIARAEQSFAGLLRKLEKRGHDRACAQRALSRLTELMLIDDERFARLWLESRIACRAASPRRLLAGLCSRGIERDLAETGIKAALDAEAELNLLRRYVKKIEKRKNFGSIIRMNQAEPERSLKYYLKGEGFSSLAIEMYLDTE